VSLPHTPSQTVGPFFSVGLPWPDGPYAVAEGTPGAIWLRGRILDGHGDPVPDSMVESWQADPNGRFDHADTPSAVSGLLGFRGFARCMADEDGRYAILTLKPGMVPAQDGSPQAPSIDLSVFARGLLKRVVSRIYFADEEVANAVDPMLTSLVDPAARATLIAERTDDGYRLDIRLQGERETVFFAL
jgi:protocatechuate 3,4-dioxygenase, alpha subunit